MIDGDGSLLMQLGSLASIAGAAPANFYHFVLVNGVYETSGFQPIPAAGIVDFAAMAKGAGYRAGVRVRRHRRILRERLPGIFNQQGPAMVALKVELDDARKEVPADRPKDQAGYLRSQLVG